MTSLSSSVCSSRAFRRLSRRSGRRHPLLVLSALALAALALPRPASAQATPASRIAVGGLALEQLDPAPAGDALFGVPSPSVGGHLMPRALLMFDYAHNPLQLHGDNPASVVSSQAFLRLDASLSLWERLLVSLDMPFAVLQAGDDPGTPGVAYHVPSSAAAGDLRLGVRGRLFGADHAPFQMALGAYLFVPTAPAGSYAGEGAFRGAPHVLVGGRLPLSAPLSIAWSATAGAVLRGSDNPHTLTFGAGAALVLGRDRLRIGPELYGAAPLSDRPMLSAPGAIVTSSAPVNAELLLGARVRLLGGLELGAAGGPGLSSAIGTPAFRLVALAGWSPAPSDEPAPQARPADRDGDGILDTADACPGTRGIASDDRARHGCPKADRDGDGVLDVADACPMTPGPSSLDLTKNGCPPDRDGDGIADVVDACPDLRGAPSAAPRQNGCPGDRDGDGVLDRVDACPSLAGESSPDRSRNGCPEDIDGDGLKPPEDACPREKGARDPDPTQSGCPKNLRIRDREIALRRPIRFVMYGRDRKDTVEPIPDEVLTEVRDVLEQHPEIKLVEVRGHADDAGDPAFNLRIAEERADAVRLWLVEAGVPKEKLVAKGYGDTDPIAPNRTQDDRQKNRRVQLFILQEE
ncbi:OmpA family protein [Sorangium sp. So ce426]|uniref:OmpA family protein n=1 Tax=Sorangium sp. So ce426 TaxID=3133312 RepID=UPI003F5C8385